ncbi:MAG: hypothetical protein WBM61_15915 [Woeseiaceae bacterium]
MRSLRQVLPFIVPQRRRVFRKYTGTLCRYEYVRPEALRRNHLSPEHGKAPCLAGLNEYSCRDSDIVV